MEFIFPEDQKFFQELLCDEREDLSKYESLFDFRPPILKRQEFNRIMKQVRLQLENLYGRVCQLQSFRPVRYRKGH